MRLSLSETISSFFTLTAAIVLSVTASLKFLSALSEVKYLDLSEPVLGWLTIRQLIVIAALVESCVAAFLFWGSNEKVKLALIGWLSSMFLIYRIMSHWINPVVPCPCLGRATDWMHIQPTIVDAVMKCVLGYMLIGSYGLLSWIWCSRRHCISEKQVAN